MRKKPATMACRATRDARTGKAVAKTHEALRALARMERYDDGKAVALSKEAGTAIVAIALQRARLEQKRLAVLTPDQRQYIKQPAAPEVSSATFN